MPMANPGIKPKASGIFGQGLLSEHGRKRYFGHFERHFLAEEPGPLASSEFIRSSREAKEFRVVFLVYLWVRSILSLTQLREGLETAQPRKLLSFFVQ